MKKRVKAQIYDGVSYLKYAQVASIIGTFLPILIIPLSLFNSALGGLLIGYTFIFSFFMSLSFLIFTLNGFKGLRKIEEMPFHSLVANGYKLASAYIFVLIGGYLYGQFFVEGLYEKYVYQNLYNFTKAMLLVGVFYVIVLFLKQKEEEVGKSLINAIIALLIIQVVYEVLKVVGVGFEIRDVQVLISYLIVYGSIELFHLILSICSVLLIIALNRKMKAYDVWEKK